MRKNYKNNMPKEILFSVLIVIFLFLQISSTGINALLAENNFLAPHSFISKISQEEKSFWDEFENIAIDDQLEKKLRFDTELIKKYGEELIAKKLIGKEDATLIKALVEVLDIRIYEEEIRVDNHRFGKTSQNLKKLLRKQIRAVAKNKFVPARTSRDKCKRLLSWIFESQLKVREINKLWRDIDKIGQKYKKESDKTVLESFPRGPVLITYADSFLETPNQGSGFIKTTSNFIQETLQEIGITNIHFLPSIFANGGQDRGFDVIDYMEIAKEMGTEKDLEQLAQGDVKLMMDLVLNHVSIQNAKLLDVFKKGTASPYFNHFKIYKKNSEEYNKIQQSRDKIFRPRPGSPLIDIQRVYDNLPEKVKEKIIFNEELSDYVIYCTFNKSVGDEISVSQVDVNDNNPEFLKEHIEAALFYGKLGASVIRLDAMGLWKKEWGTSCFGRPEVHDLMKLFRQIFNIYNSSILLSPEVHAPEDAGKTYLGNGKNEGQIYYSFSSSAVSLSSVLTGNAKQLSEKIKNQFNLGKETASLNIGMTHDHGFSVTGALDVLSAKDIDFLVRRAKESGGLVGKRSVSDPTQEARYEVGVTIMSMLLGERKFKELALLEQEKVLKQYAAVLSLRFFQKGIPTLYYHELFGSENNTNTDYHRDVVRLPISIEELNRKLKDKSSKEYRVLYNIIKPMTQFIQRHKAFHPSASQEIVLVEDEAVFSLLRTSLDEGAKVWFLQNLSDQEKTIQINVRNIFGNSDNFVDAIDKNRTFVSNVAGIVEITLKPFERVLLEPNLKINSIAKNKTHISV
ncbi:alpha-amylase family glycosyl hydrolase [Candidatus Auribacterota bacterium]